VRVSGNGASALSKLACSVANTGEFVIDTLLIVMLFAAIDPISPLMLPMARRTSVNRPVSVETALRSLTELVNWKHQRTRTLTPSTAALAVRSFIGTAARYSARRSSLT
jgi:hypothetical protein